MADLQALKKELAARLQAKDEAIQTAIKAEELYMIAFNKWQTENAEVVSASNIADGLEVKAVKEFKEIRKRIGDELSAYFTEHPEAAKIEPAFGVRRSVKALYEDDIDFIKAVIESGMLFLLKPDDAAITTFVKGMVIEGENPLLQPYNVIPPKVFDSLPALGVQTVFKATISDKKLQS